MHCCSVWELDRGCGAVVVEHCLCTHYIGTRPNPLPIGETHPVLLNQLRHCQLDSSLRESLTHYYSKQLTFINGYLFTKCKKYKFICFAVLSTACIIYRMCLLDYLSISTLCTNTQVELLKKISMTIFL